MIREYAKVSPKLWRSKKFRLLHGSAERLLYFYLLTCPHSNSAGVYHMPQSYISADLGWEDDITQGHMTRLIDVGLIEYDHEEEAVMITNWFRAANAPTNPRHLAGIVRQIVENPSKTLAAKAMETLKEECGDKLEALPDDMKKLVSSLSQGLLDTETETETKTETVTETETATDTETETEKNTETETSTDAAPETFEVVTVDNEEFPDIPEGLRRTAKEPVDDAAPDGASSPGSNPLVDALHATERMAALAASKND